MSRWLKTKGFEPVKQGGVRGFRGLKLRLFDEFEQLAGEDEGEANR